MHESCDRERRDVDRRSVMRKPNPNNAGKLSSGPVPVVPRRLTLIWGERDNRILHITDATNAGFDCYAGTVQRFDDLDIMFARRHR